MNASSGEHLWQGSAASLDRKLRIRASFTEQLDGVTADNFDSTVFLQPPGNEFLQEQIEKSLRHEEHRLRLQLRRKPDFLSQMVEEMLNHGALSNKSENVSGVMFSKERATLLDLLFELQRPQNWSFLIGNAVQGALYENLANSEDMTSDEAKGPVLLSFILGMIQQSESRVAKMKGKKLVFLVGDTGSGKSTTASYLLNIRLEEEKGPMGRAWTHKNRHGPLISASWSVSQTLYAESFDVNHSNRLFALVDSPGFEDTRGDAYRMVTALSLDRAVAAAERIPSVVLTVPYSLISEKRGQSLLELLTKVRGRFPKVLDLEQFEQGQPDEGLHIIVTKSNRLTEDQIRAIESGAFAREALKHCQENMKRFESSPLDAQVLWEQSRMWKSLQHLASRKRIHVLDLGDKKQRKLLLQSLSRQKPGPFKKPQYATSFHDPKLQKVLEVFVSTAANTWRRFFEKFQELPVLTRQAQVRSHEVQKEVVLLEERRGEQERSLNQSLNKWKRFKQDLDEKGSTEEDLENLVGQQARQEWTIANLSVSQCNLRLQNSRFRFESEKHAADSAEAKVDELQKRIEELRNGSTRVELFVHRSPEKELVFYKDCGDETQEKALEEVRGWDIGKCKRQVVVDPATHHGPVGLVAYIPKEYRLVPADEEQRKRFQDVLSEEAAFGSTVAKVSGEKYTLLAGRASPDGRTIVVLFEMNYDGSPPYPHVQVVHQIPNEAFNEAPLLNADAELTDLLSQKERAFKAKSSEQAQMESLEAQCAREQRQADEILHTGKLNGVAHRLAMAERQLEDFEKSAGDFQAEVARLQAESVMMTQTLSKYRRQHAELAFTIKAFYHKVVPALLQLSEYVWNILTSGAVNTEVFQELDLFLKAHEEANQTDGGILAMADVVLAQYRNNSSNSN